MCVCVHECIPIENNRIQVKINMKIKWIQEPTRKDKKRRTRQGSNVFYYNNTSREHYVNIIIDAFLFSHTPFPPFLRIALSSMFSISNKQGRVGTFFYRIWHTYKRKPGQDVKRQNQIKID